ncbi:hypothetical protein [Sphingobacterium deserti]|uniref:Uncharacterized protein n=1 Tax=Sphingobacterium deserti TaxID=1229276 RepID=A0A0B8T3N5_9SPHI|nr:hypothetical protein [Sphingobacterium deserti]KGE16177.1 hypothetical protein DI53_0010 [Sphingobacterium deserti]
MTREELKKGNVIRERQSDENDMKIAFHYVMRDNENVGIGLFHGDNPHCTIAMIKDFKGNPLGQEESAGYPTTEKELDELDALFHDYLED